MSQYTKSMLDIRETPQYQEYSIFRHDYFHKLLAWKDKRVIKVITGVRRCGKSMVMTELCKELSKSIPYTNITFLNFEMLENEELQEYHALYTALKSRIQPSSMNYILLDEIQLVPQFEKAVDSLFLLPNVDIYLTGSNANMLSSEIATLLSGRYVEIHIQPFSFQEFQLGYEKRFPNNNLDKESLYTKFITYGGFPYLHNIYEQQENIREYIAGLYATIVLKDIQQRKKINDTMLLERIVRFTLQNTSNLISPKKISDTFVSAGKKTSPAMVEHCLSALCETYLFYKINRYDIKGKEILKTLEKYYAVDMGLRFFMLGAKTGDEGHILENIIFLELKRRGYQLFIGKIDTLEVDFVAIKDAIPHYVQVSLTVREEATLHRELRPLLTIKDNFPKTILTMDNAPATYHNGIKQLYALDFLNGEAL